MAEKIFTGNETFLLWGAGHWGKLFIEFFPDVQIKAFIDSDTSKQGGQYCGYSIYSYEDAKNKFPDSIIVVTMVICEGLCGWLQNHGYTQGKDFFNITEFTQKWSWDTKQQYAEWVMYLYPNSTCVYKCEGCRSFLPYATKRTIFSIEQLKQDVDLLFENISRVGLLGVSFGEPLLHPDICTLLKYISDRYSNQYLRLDVDTTGVPNISDENLKLLAGCKKFQLCISDYSDEHPKQKERALILINRLNEHGVYNRYTALSEKDTWIDWGNPNVVNETDEEKLRQRFESCQRCRPGMAEGKFIGCAHAGWGYYSCDIPLTEGDYADLAKKPQTDEEKQHIHNVLMSNPDKGFFDFCARCNGAIREDENDYSGISQNSYLA